MNQLNFGANSLKLYEPKNWNSLLCNAKRPANLKVIKTLIKTEMEFRVVAQYVLTNIQQVLYLLNIQSYKNMLRPKMFLQVQRDFTNRMKYLIRHFFIGFT